MQKIKPKKRYSQNFLLSERMLDYIADAAGLSSNDTVVEIGAGDGRLSTRLAQRAKLIAIEIDRSLESVLRKRLAGMNATIIMDDFFNLDLGRLPERFKVVANLPYASAKEIIRILVELRRVELMIICLQKEVAEKYINDKKNRNFLGWWLSFYADCQRLTEIKAEQFFPAPKVDSEIIAIHPKKKSCYMEIDKESYIRFLKTCWTHPKRMLANNLGIDNKVLGDFASKRAHQIDQNGFLELYKIWSEYEEKKGKE